MTRVMRAGGDRAKRLKLVDRISDVISFGFVNDYAFLETCATGTHILPHAAAISEDMHRELSDLIANREEALGRWQRL